MTQRFRMHELPDKERLLLSALPYKVGVFVSHAVDEAGEVDDRKEMKALSSLLKTLSEGLEIPAIVRQICQGALDRQDHWEIWENNSLRTPDECRQAIALLKPRLSEKDLRYFRSALLKIAVAVAEAHGEFDMYDEEEQQTGMGRFFGKIKDAMSQMSGEGGETKADNISPAEQAALDRLSSALSIK